MGYLGRAPHRIVTRIDFRGELDRALHPLRAGRAAGDGFCDAAAAEYNTLGARPGDWRSSRGANSCSDECVSRSSVLRA